MAQIFAPYTFTGQSSLFQKFTNNTSSDNVDFGNTFINQYTLELVHKFPSLFSEQTFYLQTFPNQRYYTLPAQIRKINTVVINVGNVEGTTTTGAGFNWPVKECPTMEFWNEINMVNNITSDIPLWYFFYNGQLGIYPMPAAGYNPITIRAQAEITGISKADYVTGTIASIPYTQDIGTAPDLGALLVTLSAPWTLPTGTYQILFSDGEIILASFTEGVDTVVLQHEVIGTPNYQQALVTIPGIGSDGIFLTENFSLPTGNYEVTFSDGEKIVGAFTNGTNDAILQTPIQGEVNGIIYLNNEDGGNVVTMTSDVQIRTAQGGDIVTGAGTTWNSSMVGEMFRMPYSTSANGGDNFPYIINQVYTTTVLALNTSYAGLPIVGGSSTYTIGQISIIPTAYQLYPVYRSAQRYYTVTVKDKERREQYTDDADTLYKQLTDDMGNKDTDPTVQDDFGTPMVNPNLAINLTQSSGISGN